MVKKDPTGFVGNIVFTSEKVEKKGRYFYPMRLWKNPTRDSMFFHKSLERFSIFFRKLGGLTYIPAIFLKYVEQIDFFENRDGTWFRFVECLIASRKYTYFLQIKGREHEYCLKMSCSPGKSPCRWRRSYRWSMRPNYGFGLTQGKNNLCFGESFFSRYFSW